MLLPPPVEPTPTPETTSITLPNSDAAQKVRDLPDPSYLLNTQGTIHTAYITINDASFDARLYSINDVGNASSNYLSACTDAGYKWEVCDLFTGYTAYRIYGGGYDAYLVLDYGSTTLLLVEQGMPVQDMMPAPEAYEKNKLLMNVNGIVFQTDFISEAYVYGAILDDLVVEYKDYYRKVDLVMDGVNIVFFNKSVPYQLICLNFPDDLKTAKEYVMTKDSDLDFGFIMVDDTGFTVSNDDKYHSTWGFEKEDTTACIWKNWYNTYKIGLENKQDYYKLQLIYASGNEYRGRFEGSLFNGTLNISGTFWVEGAR